MIEKITAVQAKELLAAYVAFDEIEQKWRSEWEDLMALIKENVSRGYSVIGSRYYAHNSRILDVFEWALISLGYTVKRERSCGSVHLLISLH